MNNSLVKKCLSMVNLENYSNEFKQFIFLEYPILEIFIPNKFNFMSGVEFLEVDE